MTHEVKLILLKGVQNNSFVTIMDDVEEDPFVDVTIHIEPLFVKPFPLNQLFDPPLANVSGATELRRVRKQSRALART